MSETRRDVPFLGNKAPRTYQTDEERNISRIIYIYRYIYIENSGMPMVIDTHPSTAIRSAYRTFWHRIRLTPLPFLSPIPQPTRPPPHKPKPHGIVRVHSHSSPPHIGQVGRRNHRGTPAPRARPATGATPPVFPTTQPRARPTTDACLPCST